MQAAGSPRTGLPEADQSVEHGLGRGA